MYKRYGEVTITVRLPVAKYMITSLGVPRDEAGLLCPRTIYPSNIIMVTVMFCKNVSYCYSYSLAHKTG